MTFIENKKKEFEILFNVVKDSEGYWLRTSSNQYAITAWGFTEKAMSDAVTDYRLRMEQAMKITVEHTKEWASTGKTTTEGFISIEEHNRLVKEAVEWFAEKVKVWIGQAIESDNKATHMKAINHLMDLNVKLYLQSLADKEKP